MFDMTYWLRGVHEAKIDTQARPDFPCEICRRANTTRRIQIPTGLVESEVRSHHVCSDCLDAYRRAASQFR